VILFLSYHLAYRGLQIDWGTTQALAAELK
jgi:hypothetical protein